MTQQKLLILCRKVKGAFDGNVVIFFLLSNWQIFLRKSIEMQEIRENIITENESIFEGVFNCRLKQNCLLHKSYD
jgi:hypothetical protein